MEFYGAMDGAGKFVRGDAIAALIITVINIVGGLIMAMVYGTLTLNEAFEKYTILTIGDGPVAAVRPSDLRVRRQRRPPPHQDRSPGQGRRRSETRGPRTRAARRG